jgi:hypothetical protein
MPDQPDYAVTALYFERRAKTARNERERDHFLEVARSYRDLARQVAERGSSARPDEPTGPIRD